MARAEGEYRLCSSCSTEVPEGARHCTVCGAETEPPWYQTAELLHLVGPQCSCGAANTDHSTFCHFCGQQLDEPPEPVAPAPWPEPRAYGPPPGYGPYPPPWAMGRPQGPRPPDHLVWAILATVLCCMPLGVVSIVYAAKVESLWISGNQRGAVEASEKAKNWAIASAAISFLIPVIWLLILVLSEAASGT
jgi:hypothetical protein